MEYLEPSDVQLKFVFILECHCSSTRFEAYKLCFIIDLYMKYFQKTNRHTITPKKPFQRIVVIIFVGIRSSRFGFPISIHRIEQVSTKRNHLYLNRKTLSKTHCKFKNNKNCRHTIYLRFILLSINRECYIIHCL